MTKTELDRFEAALDRWGADLREWPADEAKRARALLESSAAARELLTLAERLDDALAALPVLPAGPALKHTIIEAATIPDAAPPDYLQAASDYLTGRFWRGALAGTLPLLVGFVLGASQTYSEDALLAEELSMLTLTTTFEDYIDEQ